MSLEWTPLMCLSLCSWASTLWMTLRRHTSPSCNRRCSSKTRSPGSRLSSGYWMNPCLLCMSLCPQFALRLVSVLTLLSVYSSSSWDTSHLYICWFWLIELQICTYDYTILVTFQRPLLSTTHRHMWSLPHWASLPSRWTTTVKEVCVYNSYN